MTWNDSQRSRSLARVAGFRRVLLAGSARGLRRHVVGTLETMQCLWHDRPAVVWYQYSVALGAVIAIYARLTGASVVADIHTKALQRRLSGVAGAILFWLKGRSLRSCDAVLVASEQNASYAREQFGLDPIVLPDPPPQPVPAGSVLESPTSDVVFICSFASDEPVSFIVQVAGRLRGKCTVAVTGDPSQLPPLPRAAVSA